MPGGWRDGLRRIVRRKAFERDLTDELQFHLDMQTAHYVARGMSEAEARQRARREFGAVEGHRDAVRDVRGVTAFDDLSRDVRVAARGLRRTPGFVAMVVLCLGLGIGASAAVFSMLSQILLTPLPYRAPHQLVSVFSEWVSKTGQTGRGAISWPNYIDWRDRNRTLSGLAAYSSGSATLRVGDTPERVTTLLATTNYFTTMSLPALLGRTFDSTDVAGAPLVVLNERYWRSRFAGDPAVVGRSLSIDGTARTVIGVVPAAYSVGINMWLPFAPTDGRRDARENHFLQATGRLREGVTPAQAKADLEQLQRQIATEHPEIDPTRSVGVRATLEDLIGNTRPVLRLLAGAVALVLLIACANVTNLLMARGSTRRQEVAVRLALGASRGRLVRQFLVESLMLSLASALLGGALAAGLIRVIRALPRGTMPRTTDLHLDWRVLLFLTAAAVICSIVVGLLPALQSTRQGTREGMSLAANRLSASRSQSRTRSLLVVAEIALSLVLLVCGALLVRGLLRLRDVPTGFTADGILTARLVNPAVPAGASGEAQAAFTQQYLDAVRRIPGVEAAGMISMLPIRSAWTNSSYTVAGRPPVPRGEEPWAETRVTTPGYFGAMGIPVLRGRDFIEADLRSAAPMIIINQTLAAKEFPGEDPVGRRLLFDTQEVPIIGVVGDIRQAGLDREPLAEVHWPARAGGADQGMTLVVRGTLPPAPLADALRRELAVIDPRQPLYDIVSMNEVLDASLGNRELSTRLIGGFALVALLLATAGLYGVITYLVGQRTREIGIRMALGARTTDVVALMTRQGARMVIGGLVLGVVGALGLSGLLDRMLYGIGPRDPVTIAGVTLLLAGIAGAATWIAARRAARIEPVRALRSE